MNIDLNKVYANDHQYIDSIIQSLQESAWKELESSKLQGSSSEELTIMRNLWSHGFAKGCEVSTQLSMYIWEAFQKNKKNETSTSENLQPK